MNTKIKNLIEEYIKKEKEEDEDTLHEILHEIDHEVYRNEFYLVLNKIDDETEIVALLVGDDDEEFFLPVYTDEAEANQAIEFFKQQEGSGQFTLDKGKGSEIIDAYAQEEGFLGLAINAPQSDFVVFTETIHDCE